MKIPNSVRTKALVIVDVQPAFETYLSRAAIGNIELVLESVSYDRYVGAVLSAEVGSIWDKQTRWTLPKTHDTHMLPSISALLPASLTRYVHKHTKSVFRGDPALEAWLCSAGIEELHLVGCDINDCVLATALDSFDRGFFTYVIEECCAATSNRALENSALDILRHLNLTNNSCAENVGWRLIRNQKCA
jgi:nicotinamidase-related amidase